MTLASVILVALPVISSVTSTECPSEPDDIIGNYTGLQGGGTYATVTKKDEVYTWTDKHERSCMLYYSGNSVSGDIYYRIGNYCNLFDLGYIKLINNYTIKLVFSRWSVEFTKISDNLGTESPEAKSTTAEPNSNMRCKTAIRHCGRKKRSEVQGTDYIMGGHEAEKHEFPFMAKLSMCFRNDGCYACGGSIISAGWILTAAHCVTTTKSTSTVLAQSGSVLVGAHNLWAYEANKIKIPVDVNDIIVHASYERSAMLNDIALVKLPQPIEFNEYIQSICLPQKGNTLSSGDITTAMGWGRTESGRTSSVLLEVHGLKVTDCPKDDESYVCIYKSRGKGTGKGDSGGVLAKKFGSYGYIQYGVTSHGISGGYDAFANTEYYYDWIIKHTSKC